MLVYLVRHGESQDNQNGIHQIPQTPLSEIGLRQAEFLANRFEKIYIDKIISSPYLRTKQTAAIISDKINKEIEFSKLLVEVRNPSELNGIKRDSQQSLSIRKLIDDNFHNPEWKYSNEESFSEAKDRAIKLINNLTKLKHKSVLLVSHGKFIRLLVAVMIFGSELTSHQFFVWNKSVKTNNTGLGLCEYSKEEKQWTLITWNDHSHLG